MSLILFPEVMIDIARHGGGLDIDCSARILLPDIMVEIAAAAAASGKRPTIIFRNLKILAPDIANKIAAAGQGCVIFVV
ncbi:hypothetical protein NKH55_01885 [Mesorhizobium opportunistum]|uniref:hypothetical protein n=1 Tax=Mesorhizobium opportunistum TaxID=593909 RepID=UPI00333A7D31